MLSSLVTALFLAVLPLNAADPGGAAPTASASPAQKPVWWGQISVEPPGVFPPPHSFQGSYRVTWEGLEAAQLETQCTSAGNEISTAAQVHTTGVARSLYKFDATHLSVVDRKTLRPERIEQTEDVGLRHGSDRVDFTPDSAIRTSIDPGKDGAAPRTRTRKFSYAGLYDMESAFLYMRSLPLAVGETRKLLVMTSGSPYLATIHVVGHERVQVAAGDFPAFKYSLNLEKINKSGDLEPRKGFKNAYAWVTDDANRLIVKAQTDVFIGTVTAELQNISFREPVK